MSQGSPRPNYVTSLGSIPTRYWPMMLQIFQQRGIAPSNIPNLAPLPAPPESDDPIQQQFRMRMMSPYMSPNNDLAQQQAPADLTQAGLALAQLGQPQMAQQQPTPLQGLLSPQIAANTTTDPQYLRGPRGLLDPNFYGGG